MEPMNDIVSFLPKLTKLAGIIMLPATFIVILLNTGSEDEKFAGWINLMITGACIGFAISLILMIFML